MQKEADRDALLGLSPQVLSTHLLSIGPPKILIKHTDTRFSCMESCLCIHDCELASGKGNVSMLFFPGTWPVDPGNLLVFDEYL